MENNEQKNPIKKPINVGSGAPKTAPGVPPKTAPGVPPRSASGVTAKTTPRVTPKTTTGVPPRSASVPPKTASTVTPKTASTVTPKTASGVPPRSAVSPTKTSGNTQSVGARSTSPQTGVNSQRTQPQTSGGQHRPNIKEVDSSGIKLKADNTTKKRRTKKLLILLLLLFLIIGGVGVAVYFITRTPSSSEMKFSIIAITTYNGNPTGGEGETQTCEYWPGNNIETSLTIKIKNDNGISTSQKVYLRFKIEVIIDDNNYIGGLFDPVFTNEEDWQHSSDNYYYYNYLCYGDEEFTPFTELNFVAERNNNELNGKRGQIIFTIEILEKAENSLSQWHTAPIETWNPTTKN